MVSHLQLVGAAESDSTIVTAVIHGSSMQPSLDEGDVIQLHSVDSKTVFRHGQLIAMSFTGRDQRMIKRMFALPGDKLTVENGLLLINDIIVVPAGWPEDFEIPEKKGLVLKRQLQRYNNTIPANRFVVLGDNPFNSLDSLEYGFVERTQITGVVVDDR